LFPWFSNHSGVRKYSLKITNETIPGYNVISSLLKPSSLQRKIGAMTIARSLSALFAFAVMIVLTRILPEEGYGAYRKLWLLYGLTGPMFVSSLVGTLYYRGGVAKERSIAIWANILLAGFYSLLVGLLGFFGAPLWSEVFNSPGLTAGFRHFAPYMMFSTFAGIAEPIFVIIERKRWLLYYNLVYNIAETFLIIVPFWMGLPLGQVVLLMSIGPALRTLYLVGLALRKSGRLSSWATLKGELPASLRYGLGIMLTAFIGVAIQDADKWIISNYFNSDRIYAIYAVGARKIPFVAAVATSVGLSIISQYSKEMSKGNYKPLLRAVKKSTNQLSLVLLPLLVVMFIFAEELMVVIFKKYAASAPIFRIYLGTIITSMLFPQSFILGMGLSQVQARMGALELVVNLGLSLWLVRYMGLLGPAVGTLAGSLFYTALLMRYARKNYGISYAHFLPSLSLWPMILSLAGLAGVSYWLKLHMPALWAFAVGLVLMGLVMLLHLWVFHRSGKRRLAEQSDD